jgi:hypothetical protein
MGRLEFEADDTSMLLRLYFGLVQGRSIKRKALYDELVRRGVSVVNVIDAIEQTLFAIGWAADNRIPEIDQHLEGE